jgi:MFS family permease
MQPDRCEFYWYMAGRGCYFTAFGIQSVLFAWLLAIGLQESAERIGVAQMLQNLPLLVLLLFGGAIADRSDCRRLLMRLQMLLTVPPLALLLLEATGGLDFLALALYGIAVGTLGAFVIPARDSLLTKVSSAEIQRGVTMMMLVQFGGQLTGILLAGTAGRVGPIPLLAVQAAIMAVSAYSSYRLTPAPPEPRERATRHLADIVAGLGEAARSPRIGSVILYIFADGVLFIGLYLVVLPLLVRDVYGGGSGMLAGFNSCFMVGITLMLLVLLRYGDVRRPGRVLMLAAFGDFVVPLILRLAPPEWLAYACLLFWGLGAGLSMNMSRSLVQAAAPPFHRARILAIYQLGFIGGAPIGAIFIGYLVQRYGLFDAMLVPVCAMAGVWIAIFLLSPLWRLEPGRSGA